MGARRLKAFCNIPAGVGAIGRILRQRGLTCKRKKRWEKKRDLREQKARYKPFEQLQVDTKHLSDIPYSVEQLWRHGDLPRYQYSCRDVKTGAVFVGYSNHLGEVYSCCFLAAVAAHHRYIPVGKKNHQADVESFHERIETEFFDLETFRARPDFFAKASAYVLWRSTVRLITTKAHRSPDQIFLTQRPDRDPGVWFLPALDLDRLLAKRASGAFGQQRHHRGILCSSFTRKERPYSELAPFRPRHNRRSSADLSLVLQSPQPYLSPEEEARPVASMMPRTVTHEALEQHGVFHSSDFAGALDHHPFKSLEHAEPLATVFPHFREKQQSLVAPPGVEGFADFLL